MSLEDKTEAPTPRRREEAREEGQVARSVEVNAAAILITGLMIMKMTGARLGEALQDTMTRYLSTFPKGDLSVNGVCSSLARLLLDISLALAPLILGVVVIAFVVNVAQVGLKFSSKSLQIKGSRLNPIQGIGNMFSSRSLVELTKSLLKIGIVGYVIYSYLSSKTGEISAMVGATYLTTCTMIGEIAYQLLLRASLVILVIAVADYIYQRFQHEKRLKMTKQEVKDDAKRSDGDPHIKGKIRAKQREIAQRRMMAEVPKADVVVTNPTHFAVALKYDSERGAAPMVVAKGMDFLAQRIKAIAQENNVPMVENVQLARALYASVEIGDEIPGDLYQAVAEILAYVYRLNNRLKR